MIWTSVYRLSRIVRLALIVGVIPTSFLFSIREVSYASTVSYTLDVDGNAGTWRLFGAATLGDNTGIATVGVSLLNIDTPVDLQLPTSMFVPGDIPVQAFTDFRSDANPISGSQDTFGGAGIVYGFGQFGGTLDLPPANAFVQQNYNAKLLIAQGTYDGQGTKPSFSDASAMVFTDMLGFDIHQPLIETAVVPEPGSVLLALLALGTGVLSRRQRLAR